MIVWKKLRNENGEKIVECEMTMKEYRLCEGLLTIENGKKLWEEVWKTEEKNKKLFTFLY